MIAACCMTQSQSFLVCYKVPPIPSLSIYKEWLSHHHFIFISPIPIMSVDKEWLSLYPFLSVTRSPPYHFCPLIRNDSVTTISCLLSGPPPLTFLSSNKEWLSLYQSLSVTRFYHSHFPMSKTLNSSMLFVIVLVLKSINLWSSLLKMELILNCCVRHFD